MFPYNGAAYPHRFFSWLRSRGQEKFYAPRLHALQVLDVGLLVNPHAAVFRPLDPSSAMVEGARLPGAPRKGVLQLSERAVEEGAFPSEEEIASADPEHLFLPFLLTTFLLLGGYF